MFENDENEESTFLEKTDDWISEVKLTKEFEFLGFYISDHPLNQYKTIFDQYNIMNYTNFESNNDVLSSNVACTVLKIQEKKTQKGSSYAIVKFSDLINVFELFIFSDIFEMNRETLKEGNSIMLTLIKNYKDNDKSQKRINVKKIVSLKEFINKPLKNITFKFSNVKEMLKIKTLSKKDADTEVEILLHKDNELMTFKLKDKRKVNNNLINSLKLNENVVFD